MGDFSVVRFLTGLLLGFSLVILINGVVFYLMDRGNRRYISSELTGKFTRAILWLRKEIGMPESVGSKLYHIDPSLSGSQVESLRKQMFTIIHGAEADEFANDRLANPVLPSEYVDSYGGRYGGGFFKTSTRYNTGEENLMEAQSLYEVFLVDRDKAVKDPMGCATVLLVVAANPEAARTIVIISEGIKVSELNAYHIASREVCRIPYLPRQDRLLPDNGGKVNGE